MRAWIPRHHTAFRLDRFSARALPCGVEAHARARHVETTRAGSPRTVKDVLNTARVCVARYSRIVVRKKALPRGAQVHNWRERLARGHVACVVTAAT